MKNDKSLKCWIDCCQQSEKESGKPFGAMSIELWNRRADGFAKSLSPRRKGRRSEEIFEVLAEAGFQAQGAKVLDLGCGPGALAIPLARAGAEVTGLDISGKALDYLRQNAESEGLSVETIEASWWDVNIDRLGLRGKFDLVIASMTPSIRDEKTFTRMMECSRNFCYYSHFVMGHPGARDAALERITGLPSMKMRGKIPTFLAHFMRVYLSGYRPVVRVQRKAGKRFARWEEAAERAIQSYEFDGGKSAAAKKKIVEYYKKLAADGVQATQPDVYTGMMAWSIKA